MKLELKNKDDELILMTHRTTFAANTRAHTKPNGKTWRRRKNYKLNKRPKRNGNIEKQHENGSEQKRTKT